MSDDLFVRNRKIIARIFEDNFDLEEYDAFLDSWQKLVEEHGSGASNEELPNPWLLEFEGLARTALERLITPETSGEGFSGSALFNSLQVGAIICDIEGVVIQSNDTSRQEFGLHDRVNLRQAALTLESGDLLDPIHFETESDLNIIQCFREDGASVNIAILALGGEKREFLIVFMNTPWGPEAQGLLAARFGLTEAESEIVGAFASGVSLKQIAVDRGRAYTTIRNQFQAILEKTGCPNQADLLRLLLGTSYLFSQIHALVVAEPPVLGKAMEMVRPGGRLLDVQLFGDLQGQPFICLPSIFGLPITATIDAELRKRKLLMIGVARPGFGGTSPPKPGRSIYDCLARDVTAILDSMEIERCVFIGRASAARSLFKLTNLIPDRITRAVFVNGMVPRSYVEGKKVRSSWTRSLMSASHVSAAIASLILGAGEKILRRVGTEKFITRMYRRSAADRAVAADPEVADSITRGVRYVMQQNLRAGALDMIDGFTDWREDIGAAQVPCTMFHGREDPHVPIAAVRAFAKDYPERVDFIEVEDGGGLLNYTHTDQLFSMVAAEVGTSFAGVDA